MSTYKRRYPKKTYRKKRYVKKAPNDRRIRAIVKKEMTKEVESKYFDYTSTGSASTGLTSTSPHTGMVRGTGESGYLGSGFKPTWLSIKGQLLKSTDVAETFNQVRMIIIQDKNVSGVPNTGTMFQNVTYPWFSPLNKDFHTSYKVLFDRNYCLRRVDGIDAPFNFKVNIPGSKLRKCDFTAASGTVQSGSIWVMFISDSAVAVHPTWTYLSRLHYKDA